MRKQMVDHLTACQSILVACLLVACLGSWSIQIAQSLDLNRLPVPLSAVDRVPNGGHESLRDEITTNEEPHDSVPKTKVGEFKKSSWVKRTANRVADAIKTTFNMIPRYFDFNQFIVTFKREYDPYEYIYRRAQFLRNCLQVFKARVAFRLGLSTHKETVNRFSDRSPNEIKRMFMSAPPFEMRPVGQSEQDYYRKLDQVSKEREQWDLELDSSAAGDDPDDEAGVVEEEQARRRIKRMLDEGSSDSRYQAALHDELQGDAVSSGMSDQNPPRGGWRSLPWPGKARPPDLEIDLNMDASEKPVVYMTTFNEPYKPPELAEGDSLDWSKHECFHKVYDQGEECGKCYVLATTALVEFYKCSEQFGKIQPRKFSTNYVLNCGQKYSPTILGCRGGSLLDTLRFLTDSGTHSISQWEQIRKERLKQQRALGYRPDPLDKKCPLNKFEEPFSSWGSIKVGLEPRLAPVHEWYGALQDGPLVASVQMPRDVINYQSGTHSGFECAGSGNWHAMLLVGYGTDFEGRTFWRFRNSWGPSWGDNGHFDLAMSVDRACLSGGVRVYRSQPLSDPATGSR